VGLLLMISHTARSPVDTTPLPPGQEPGARKDDPAKPLPVPSSGPRTSPEAPTEAVKQL
jgi:hypothetical protein